ncbi:MAG: D-erythronate dehydrogenase, partial [Thermomicrobiales bacterium]
IGGDITDAQLLRSLVDPATTSVFHLAAIVSGQAEADFDLGMRINVEGSRLLLEACRATGKRPRVVFTSSIAVYGGSAMPKVVQDSTPLNPQTSYGVQKAIAELLLSDYTRKGFVDGRAMRMPTITVRPGKANRAASSFVSGIIREPLNGEEVVCPVAPETRVWVLSPRKAIENLVYAHDMSSEALGDTRWVNVPGISVSIAEMAAALERIAGKEVVNRIRWERDPAIVRLVDTWPGEWNPERALALGFSGISSIEESIRNYMEDDLPSAVKMSSATSSTKQ